jgi:metal-sulfur cluster biosynthetic enzyme
MAIHEEQVREQLKKVIDPELFINVVDLGLIYEIDIVPNSSGESGENGGEKFDIHIEMTMTSPMCPAGPQLVSQSKAYVGELEGVDSVEVKVVMDPPWTPDRMTDDARDQLGIY